MNVYGEGLTHIRIELVVVQNAMDTLFVCLCVSCSKFVYAFLIYPFLFFRSLFYNYNKKNILQEKCIVQNQKNEREREKKNS